MQMKTRFLYRNYHVVAITTPADGGKFRARVVVMALAGDRTRSQRFMDFETFDTEALADERAISGGKEWIDISIAQEALGANTNFAMLNCPPVEIKQTNNDRRRARGQGSAAL